MSSGVQLQAITSSGERVAVKATQDGYIYTTAVSVGGGIFTSISDSLLVDNAGTYWLLRDTGTSYTHVNLNTLSVGTPSGQVSPASTDNSKELIEIFYDASASGQGYSSGDILVGITLIDKVLLTIASSFWLNVTTNSVISAPAPGSYVRHNGAQNTSSTDIGVTTDAAATSDTGSFSLISLFKRLLISTATLLARVPVLGQALNSNSVPVVLPAAQIASLTPLSSVSISNLPAIQAVSGSVSVTNIPTTQQVNGTVTVNAGSNLNTSALALESGGNLASINTKTPALGQALASGSVPVVLPAAQLTALTPPTSIAVSNLPATQTVSGTVAISNFPASQSLSGSVSVSNFPATQPVSGTITANAGTNLNTSALALESGGNLAALNVKTPALGQALAASSVPVVLTAAQLATLTPPTTVNAVTSNPASIISGKKVTSTTASALTASALVNGIVITAASTNAAKIYIGPSGTTASNGYELLPGQSIAYAVQNANAIYIIGANATDYITYTGN